MAIGDPMAETVPAVSTAGTGYASSLVSLLNAMKSRLVAKVPLSSLLVGLLDMANNAITNLAYATLYAQTVTPPTNSLYNSGGNVWWVGSAGAVQITNGAVISSASIGGITGDYGAANPARFKFVTADKEYYAYHNESTGEWARVWARGFDIAGGDLSASRLRLAWVAGTSYTLTFPSNAPAAQAALQMDAAGTVTVSNDFTGAVSATGAMTATDQRHTAQQTIRINSAAAQVVASGGPTYAAAAWQAGTSTGQLWYPIPTVTGQRIKTFTLWATKNSAAGTITVTLVKIDSLTGGSTTISTATNAAATPGNIVLVNPSALDEPVTGDTSYALVVTGGGTTGDSFRDLQINVTRP